MRKSIVLVLAAMVLISSASFGQKKVKPANTASAGNVELITKMDTLSYSFGAQFGSDFLTNEININPELFAKGLKDAMSKSEKKLTDEQIQKAILDFNQEMRTKQIEKQNQLGKMNTETSEKFLKENATKPGVKVTASGLQYTITKEGTGKTPTTTDVVKVHYTGKLVDGTIFDSSIQRGEPIEFPVNGVIPGWTEGLQLMKEGGEAMLYIPSALGYGERGAGGVIGPNAALIFEVKLLEVKPAPAAAPEQK
jgi:FKBP-type peptidyl-prolyl cis-trans isomerase